MFDPIRIYDKPAVILTQLGNGIATTDSVRRALFAPAALSPRERESYTDGLKRELGNNPIVDTVIDVLGNPLTWLAFVAGGSMATQNFAKSGRMFTGGIAKSGLGEWAKSQWPVLRSFRALSMSQELSSTRLPVYMEHAASKMQNKMTELSRGVTPGVEGILRTLSEKHGTKVTSMNPADAPSAAIEHDLKLIEHVVHAKVLNYENPHSYEYAENIGKANNVIKTTYRDSEGKVRTDHIVVPDEAMAELRKNQGTAMLRRVVDSDLNVSWALDDRAQMGSEDFKSGRVRTYEIPDSLGISGVKVNTRTINRDAYVTNTARINQIIREFNLEPHIDAVRKSILDQKVLRYGDDAHYSETGEFKIDRNKVLREARANIKSSGAAVDKNGNFTKDGIHNLNALLSDDFINTMKDVTKKMPNAGMTPAEIEDLIVQTQERVLADPHYFPRNTAEVYENAGGVKMRVEASRFSKPGERIENAGQFEPSGRTKFRTREEAPWDPDDLQFMYDEFGGTPAMLDLIKDARERVVGQARQDPRGRFRVFRIAPHEALSKYISSTARDWTLFSSDAANDPYIRAATMDFRAPKTLRTHFPGPTGEMETGGLHAGAVPHVAPESLRPAGGYSLWDLIDTEMRAVEEAQGSDGYVVKTMREHVMPSVFGFRTMEDGASHAMNAYFKGTALKIANSDFMKAVESHGGVAERFVRSMRRYGNTPYDTTEFGSSIAKIFYGSTMGLNIGSALTNLMQPLHNVHQLGLRNTAKAYAQSIGQMYEFARERGKLGINPSQVQVDDLIERTFKRQLPGGVIADLHTVADLKNSWGSVERAGYGSQIVNGGFSDNLFSFIMKPFQVAETMNRLVTANAVFNAAEEGWAARGKSTIKSLDPIRAVEEARTAVESMQFGSSAMNRPAMFYQDFLRNPAIRQFLQFPVRSAVNLAAMPDMIGGTRQLGIGPFSMEVSNKFGIRGIDTMRAIGYSAIAYDVLKNLAGADISRGLLFGWVPNIDADKDKELQLPVPPFMDAGYQVIRGVMSGGDQAIMGDVVPLLIPGGVSISRALGTLPKSDTLQALGLQKKFADWGNPNPDGTVPMYDADSRYLGSYNASDIVLRSLGADMGRFNNQTEVTKFLLSNRDQMRDLRRQWIAAVLGNNMQQATGIKANFERQFGMPLTVTQQQMREAVRSREESVSERTMGSIDKDLQQQYRDMLGQQSPQSLNNGTFDVNSNARYVWSQLPKR